MDQKTNNRTTGLLVGILFLLFSLPLSWFTIIHPRTTGSATPSFILPAGPITANGLSGSLGAVGVQLPIWLVVTLGILSLVFTLLNQRGITSLPKFAFVGTWLVSTIYVLLAFGLSVSSDVTLHIGPVLAVVGLAVGLVSGFAEVRRDA